MAKFCKKCGSLLDEASGKCPNCDKVADVQSKKDAQNTSSNNAPNQKKQPSKKEIKAEKKRLKKQSKKDKKKQKRAQLTMKQKVKRFFITFVMVFLSLSIITTLTVVALVMNRNLNIPIVRNSLSAIGLIKEFDSETTVNEFLTGYQEKNVDITKYLADNLDETNFNYVGFQGLLAEKLTFFIKDVKEDDKQSVVTVEITNIDFTKAFDKVKAKVNTSFTTEDLLKKLTNELSSPSCDMRTFEVSIPLVKKDDEYKIRMTESLSNALLGGYNEYVNSLLEETGE